MFLHALLETNVNLRIDEDVVDVQLALSDIGSGHGVNGGLIERGISGVAVLKELVGVSKVEDDETLTIWNFPSLSRF